MKTLQVKKLHPEAQLPKKGSKKASGLDLHSLNTYKLKPGESVMIQTGIGFIIPEGFEIQVRPRSGVSLKTKLRVSNSPGTVDQDFQGECCVLVDNISTKESFVITKGDRIAQAVLCPVELCDTKFVDEYEQIEVVTERASKGFGHSGK